MNHNDYKEYKPSKSKHICKPLQAHAQTKACKRAYFANARTERQCSKYEMKLTGKMNNETLTQCMNLGRIVLILRVLHLLKFLAV